MLLCQIWCSVVNPNKAGYEPLTRMVKRSQYLNIPLFLSGACHRPSIFIISISTPRRKKEIAGPRLMKHYIISCSASEQNDMMIPYCKCLKSNGGSPSIFESDITSISRVINSAFSLRLLWSWKLPNSHEGRLELSAVKTKVIACRCFWRKQPKNNNKQTKINK